MIFRIAIQEGKLFSERNIRETIQGLSDGEYTLEIVKKRKIRSGDQNSFYWGPFLDFLCDEMGETYPDMDKMARKVAKEAVHEFLKGKFGEGKTIRNPADKRMRIKLPVSTTDMETVEFEQFLERIRVYFREWKWELPYPDNGNEQSLMFYENRLDK